MRIEIEHRSPKEQVEKNIRKSLEYADTLYMRASDEAAERKVVQVALRTLFRLKKERPGKLLRVKIGAIEELKRSGFKSWMKITNK